MKCEPKKKRKNDFCFHSILNFVRAVVAVTYRIEPILVLFTKFALAFALAVSIIKFFICTARTCGIRARTHVIKNYWKIHCRPYFIRPIHTRPLSISRYLSLSPTFIQFEVKTKSRAHQALAQMIRLRKHKQKREEQKNHQFANSNAFIGFCCSTPFVSGVS